MACCTLKLRCNKPHELYKETYVDQKGGVITLHESYVSLHIPADALSERQLLSIEVKSVTTLNKNRVHHSCLTPVISCKPHGMNFKKDVELIVPHCVTFDDVSLHTSEIQLDSYSETVARDSSESVIGCFMKLKENFCHIYTKTFADFQVTVNEPTRRRISVLAFTCRDQGKFIIDVLFVNDLPSECIIMKHEREENGFIPFNTTDKFTFDYYLLYSVEVRTFFSDKCCFQKYDKKILDNDTLAWAGRVCLRFYVEEECIDMSPQKITVIILQDSVPECSLLKLVTDVASNAGFSDFRSPFTDLYKEQIIDKNGGNIVLEEADVALQIPKGILTEPQLISVEVKAGNDGLSSGANPSTSVTPIVTCVTGGGKFTASVTLKMPHCAVLDDLALHEPRATYFIQDRKEEDTVSIPCQLGEMHCEISSIYLSNVEVILKGVNRKRMRFVPFARKYHGVLVIRMWLINDLYSESTLLLQQQQKLGFVMLGYERFEMSRSGEFLMTLKLVDNENNKTRRTEKIKNKMLFRRSRSCYTYLFQIKTNVAPTKIHIKIFEIKDKDNVYCLRKTFDEPLLLALQDQGETDDETVTVADTLLYCEELSTALLTWTFSKLKKKLLFPSETITSLNKTADEIERRKNIKSSAVIGGSSAGIVGGALAITGVALIPITFGASVGLIAAGTALGVAGSGVSIGFSIDKAVKDARSKDEIKLKLEEFEIFQKNFVTALSNVILIKNVINRMKRPLSFKEKRMTVSEYINTIKNIKDLIKSHDVQNHRFETISEILSEIIYQSEQAIKGLCIIDEKFKLNLIEQREISLQSMLRYRDIFSAFGLTYESNANFLGFSIDYLKLDTIPASNILPPAMSVEAVKIVLSEGATASQVAARVSAGAADASDGIAQLSSGAAKVAKGCATASFVLAGLGIVLDIGFLGHAIYELAKKAPLSEGLVAVCDLMKKINYWQNLESP